jgi:hypothetical protein
VITLATLRLDLTPHEVATDYAERKVAGLQARLTEPMSQGLREVIYSVAYRNAYRAEVLRRHRHTV